MTRQKFEYLGLTIWMAITLIIVVLSTIKGCSQTKQSLLDRCDSCKSNQSLFEAVGWVLAKKNPKAMSFNEYEVHLYVYAMMYDIPYDENGDRKQDLMILNHKIEIYPTVYKDQVKDLGPKLKSDTIYFDHAPKAKRVHLWKDFTTSKKEKRFAWKMYKKFEGKDRFGHLLSKRYFNHHLSHKIGYCVPYLGRNIILYRKWYKENRVMDCSHVGRVYYVNL
jgi:hypothetical protein